MDASAVLNLEVPYNTADKSAPAVSVGGPSSDASKAAPSGGLMKEWNDWLRQPGNSGALITAGLNMMQPIGVGQSTLGHIARAVGKGAEAKAEYQKTQQEAQSAQVENQYKKSLGDYYAAGGASLRHSLTPGQVLSDQDRNTTLYKSILDDVLKQNFDLIGQNPSDAELQAASEQADKIFQLVRAKGGGAAAGGGVAGVPSLAATTGSAPPVTKIDTQGRKWQVQNGQWVQVK